MSDDTIKVHGSEASRDPSPAETQIESTGSVRADVGMRGKADGEERWPVRRLPEASSQLRGSLPQNKSYSGNALQAVQHFYRRLGGQR